MSKQRPIIISLKEGEMPFSRDLFAKTLILGGFTVEKAYLIVKQVEDRIRELKLYRINGNELHRITKSVLTDNKERKLLTRYKNWYKLLHPNKPIIVLFLGASGVGKSYLTSEVAYALEIKRIIGTDSVREILRTFFSKELMPWIYHSTFENSKAEEPFVQWHDLNEKLLYGYFKQSEPIMVGIRAIIERAICEGLSLLVEGVHLVPDLLMSKDFENLSKRVTLVKILLHIPDEKIHYKNFVKRGQFPGASRKAEVYLQHFKEIRCIQDYLCDSAAAQNIAMVDSSNVLEARARVIDILLDKLAEH